MTANRSGLFSAGEILGDRYVLRKIEWTLDLGPVWVARDTVLDRQVFVQLLSAKLANNKGARKAFLKAAARTAQVGHPSLLRVFDIGDDPPFVVFEHASGGRLSDRLATGPVRLTDTARATLALARGLEALHDRGGWHGSLSPARVLLDAEGRPKIFANGEADVSAAAGPLGDTDKLPAGYRPPEPDPLPFDVDRYALAALTCHMLTGKPPGQSGPPRSRRGVPPPVEQLLARALSADPRVRPPLDEFDSALAPYARVELPDARSRFSGSEFRWLVPVVIVLLLAAAALTIGVQIARNYASKPSAKKSASARATATSSLVPVSVDDFDPEGNNEEHSEDTQKAIDGELDTAWKTFCYKRIDGGKDGVGLLFELPAAGATRVQIQTEVPGWSGEIRTAEVRSETPGDYQTVAQFSVSETPLETTLQRPAQKFVLLWITELTVDSSPGCKGFPYRATVSEVTFSSG